MNKTILAVRAVAAEFAKRLMWPLVLAGGGVLLVMHIVGIWLTTVYVWWWLLESLIIIFTFVFAALVIGTRMLLRIIAPDLSHTQKRATKDFVDKFERVTGNAGTPKIMLFYYIVRDSVQKRKNGFIVTAARDSTTLHKDFAKLCNLF